MATALLFSGQGSQYSGMGRKLYDENPSAYEDIFSAGSDILGFDVKKTMFEGTAEELAVTSVSQPAIFTMSLMCAKKYALDGKEFAAVAGHSLGEYAALVTAGAVDLTTGFTLIKHRAACMDKAAKKNGGKMAAIIGLPSDVIETVCAEVNGGGDYVVPVNYNTSVQTVIAGSEAGVAKAAELLKAKGAKRAVPLAVVHPVHQPFPVRGRLPVYAGPFAARCPDCGGFHDPAGERAGEFRDWRLDPQGKKPEIESDRPGLAAGEHALPVSGFPIGELAFFCEITYLCPHETIGNQNRRGPDAVAGLAAAADPPEMGQFIPLAPAACPALPQAGGDGEPCPGVSRIEIRRTQADRERFLPAFLRCGDGDDLVRRCGGSRASSPAGNCPGHQSGTHQ